METTFTINKNYLDSKFTQQEQYILQSSELVVVGKTDTDTHFKSTSKYGVMLFVVPNKFIETIDDENYIPKKRTSSSIKKDLVINHPTFGKGIVLSNKKGLTEIEFEFGKKKFETKYVQANCLN